MRKVYVAHPFGGREAEKCDVESMVKRLANAHPDTLYISPIHAVGYLYADVPYLVGMDYCFALLACCDKLILTGDWRASRGCQLEKAWAEQHKMEIGELEEEMDV